MMYKKFFTFLLTACLCFLFPINTYADVSGLAKITGDALLVYDSKLSQDAHKNVGSIADILTYMGYSVHYSSVKDSKGIINNFTHVIYYHESDNIEATFLEEIGQSNSKIMVVGGGEIKSLLQTLKLPNTCTGLNNKTAQVTYSFDSPKNISMLTKAQKIMLLQGDFSYSSGTILADGKSAPYCVRVGRLCSIAVYDGDNSILRAMLTEQIALWKWPYNDAPHSYPQHIIFGDVYPFFNTKKMMDVIEMMKGMGIPYAITVMPIYQNGEYPAMKHFCEVLRYAQASGAAIILKAPTTNTNKATDKDINKSINTAFSCYCSYGVYPIALEAPSNWIHEAIGQAVLRRFRTIVLTPNQGENGWSESEKNNVIYADGHQIIAPVISDGDNSSNLISSYPTAVYLNMLSDLKDLNSKLQRIKESSVSLKSLWLSSHSLYTEDRVLIYKNDVLTIQGKEVSLVFKPFEYDKTYKYNRYIIGRMATSFKQQNLKLLIIVCGISILFLIFIFIARYQNKNKFLYKSDRREHTGRGEKN